MTTPQQALETALQSWNEGNLGGYLELYDEDIQLHGYSPAPMGKAEVREFYTGIFSAFDSPQLVFHETIWDGHACAIRFMMSGRHIGKFMGVPATGTPIALAGITILHFRGSQVIERFSHADMLGLLVHLGAIPAPA
jgi:predicted ester cyclase